MQYTEIFQLKIIKFHWKKNDFCYILAQDIHCGYTEAVLTRTHNVCFGTKIRKICIPLQTPGWLYKRWGEGGRYEGVYILWTRFLMFMSNHSFIFCARMVIGILHFIPDSMIQMSCLMRKQTISIGENKDADPLRGNSEADQRLCFRYTDSTIPLLSKSKISSHYPSSVTVQPGLCWTWSEPKLSVFSCTGSYCTSFQIP